MPSPPRANVMALLKDGNWRWWSKDLLSNYPLLCNYLVRNPLQNIQLSGRLGVQLQDFYLGKVRDENYMKTRWRELAKRKCLPEKKLEQRLKSQQAGPIGKLISAISSEQ